jgi:hypothetical protein
MPQGSNRPAVDVALARRELVSTVEEVALYLLSLNWEPQVLRDVSDDIEGLAAKLREIANRHEK